MMDFDPSGDGSILIGNHAHGVLLRESRLVLESIRLSIQSWQGSTHLAYATGFWETRECRKKLLDSSRIITRARF